MRTTAMPADNKFSFTTDDKSEAFCLGIAQEMVTLFGISGEEAIGRINRQLQNVKEWIGDKHIYYHETMEEWAKNIYYEEDYEYGNCWWIKGSNPKAKTYSSDP